MAEQQPAGITIFQQHAGPITDLDRLQTSLHFAQISRLAYLDPGHVDPYLADLGLTAEELIDRDGAQAYVFGSETDLVIACRGTEPDEWNDLKADVNALTVLAETVGRVHRGFKREVDDLWPKIERIVGNDRRVLWFTGHSLGGAIATISAGRCYLSHVPATPQHVYTYGAPRVGTRRYVNHVSLELTRWVNNNDIVTRIPPIWLGYRHVGRRMYLDSDGRVRRLTARQRSRDRWRGFKQGLREGKLDPLSDHAIASYIEHIAHAVQARQR